MALTDETGWRAIWNQLKGTDDAPGRFRGPCEWTEALWHAVGWMYEHAILQLASRVAGQIPALRPNESSKPAGLFLRVVSMMALMVFTGPIFLLVSACIVGLSVALWVGACVMYPLRRSILWDWPRAFILQHCPLRGQYQLSSTLNRKERAARFALWLFVGLLVGAGVVLGLYFGGAPVLLFGSLLTYALMMGGASALATVGACMYADTLRDQPAESHGSRRLYYLRLLISGWLMAPLMALGGVMAPAVVAGSKLFGVVSLLVGSGAPFMTQWAVFMGLIMGAMFVIQSVSMALIGLGRYMRKRAEWVRQDGNHWTWKCEESLRVSAKMISGVLMLALGLVTLNVIPVFQAGLGAFFKTELGVWIWQIGAVIGAALVAYGVWFFGTDGLQTLLLRSSKADKAETSGTQSEVVEASTDLQGAQSLSVDAGNASDRVSGPSQITEELQAQGVADLSPNSIPTTSAEAPQNDALSDAARDKITTIVAQMIGERSYGLKNGQENNQEDNLGGASSAEPLTINAASMTQRIIDFCTSDTDEAKTYLASLNKHSQSSDNGSQHYANQKVRDQLIERLAGLMPSDHSDEFKASFPCITMQRGLDTIFNHVLKTTILPQFVQRCKPDISDEGMPNAVKAITLREVPREDGGPARNIELPEYRTVRQKYIVSLQYARYDGYWNDTRAQSSNEKDRIVCVQQYVVQAFVRSIDLEKMAQVTVNQLTGQTFEHWAKAMLDEKFPPPANGQSSDRSSNTPTA